MTEELKKLIDEAYDGVLEVANRALRNCTLFTIEILKQEDPSYEAIANQLEEAADIIEIIHKQNPDDIEGFRTAVKAREYAQDVSNLAGAIKLGDEDLLQEYIDELNRRPFV